MTANFGGYGYVIYGAFNRDYLISNNTGDTVGSTFILNSASLRSTIRDNKVRYTTIFAFKGGYGSPKGVTSDVTPTASIFSIASSGYAKSQFAPGMTFLNVSAATFPLPRGEVLSVTDNGTYLTIATTQPMSAAPSIGDSMLQLETGTLYDGNHVFLNGGNAYDLNGVQDITISAPYIRGAGMLKIGSSYSGLAIGAIWIGFDAYGGNQKVNSQGVTIASPDIEYCNANGIVLGSAVYDAVIDDYRIKNFGVVTDSPGAVTPSSWGIASNQGSYYRSNRIKIGCGIITSAQGGAILSQYSSGDTIQGLTSNTPVGVNISSQISFVARGNDVIATGASDGTYAFQVSNPSANPSNSVLLDGNTGFLSSTSFSGGTDNGYGVWITDGSATSVDVTGSNYLSSNATSNFYMTGGEIISSYLSQALGSYAKSGEKYITQVIGVGATVTLGEWSADPGTVGGLRIEGAIWDRTTGHGDIFYAVYVGDTGSSSAAATSDGNKGGSILGGLTFQTAAGSAPYLIAAQIANGTGHVVSLSVKVTPYPRF